MRYYYSADAIREAEAPLLASLPDGALMRRAAYGLATAIARELVAAHRRHRRAGRSARSSAPATTAATRCGRRRSCVAAARRPPRFCSIPNAPTRRRWPRSGRPAAESCKASRRQPIW